MYSPCWLFWLGPGVLGADVYSAYYDPVLFRDNPLDLAALAFLLTGDHLHGVPAFYLQAHLYNTSGASDIILV